MHTYKIISSFCILLISLALAPLAFAQDASVSVNANASVNGGGAAHPLDLIKARAQQLKGAIPGVKGAGDGEFRVNAQTNTGIPPGNHGPGMQMASSTRGKPGGLRALVMMHGGEIKNRFRLAIEHFNNLLGRIDTRLGKMADAGVDTSAAVQAHTDAKTAVGKAEADAQAVADFVATIDDSSDRAAAKTELQAKIKTATESLKAAHRAVMKAVRALVDLAKKNKPAAGASVDTSTSVDSSVQ